MNKIVLRGTLKNIEYSHTVQDVEYYKALLVVKREDGKDDDTIVIKFKKFSNKYKENDNVELVGNLRTFSQKLETKNKVDIYVFTYLDEPSDEDADSTNSVEIDGRICKKSFIRKTREGKDVLDLILANNLESSNGKCLNCYIPLVSWGKTAKELDKLQVGDSIKVLGKLHSRVYKKATEDGDYELKMAYEVVVDEFTVHGN